MSAARHATHDPPAITFRPMARADFPRFVGWLAEPAVARWWDEPATLDHVEAEYGPCVDGVDPTELFVVEVDGEPAGMIQRYRHRDHPEHDAAVGVPDAAGIDYLLGGAHAGRGFGTRMLRAFATEVLAAYPDCEWCVAAPARENRASWRALERAGFTRLHECEPPGEPPAYAYGTRRRRDTPGGTGAGG